MALTANEIRALQALRAPGGMTAEQAWERWPGTGTNPFHGLLRRGLIARDGGIFTITAAGRAACPFVNPLLARTPAEPKEQTPMPRNKITTSDVFDAICAAGPDGTTVIALSNLLALSDKTIFYHVKSLTREPGAVVRRPRKGLLVASRYLDGAPENADEPAVAEALGVPGAEVEKIARDYAEMTDFDIEAAQSLDLTAAPATTLGEAASLAAVNKMLDALPKLGSDAPPNPPSPFSEDIELDDPEQVEFAIFSSGGLDMYTDQGNVTLGRDVLRKLRAFLGLFAEAA